MLFWFVVAAFDSTLGKYTNNPQTRLNASTKLNSLLMPIFIRHILSVNCLMDRFGVPCP
jgi:hypothetical protein